MVTIMTINHNAYLVIMMKIFVGLSIVALIVVMFIKESDIKKLDVNESK
jgi:hypothetical protein